MKDEMNDKKYYRLSKIFEKLITVKLIYICLIHFPNIYQDFSRTLMYSMRA